MDSFQVHFNSKFATTYTNNKANCDFYLPVMDINTQNQLYVSIIHAVIPYTFYNVNSSNNYFNYTLGGTPYNFTIARGNYNVNTLKTYLTANLPFTVSYNGINNTFTFTHTTYDFVFLSSSSCLSLLGFSTTSSSTNKSLTSNQTINMATSQCVCICTNLETNNINMMSGMTNNRNVLISIPIDVAPNGLIIYKNTNNFRVNSFRNVINNINIKLEDQDGGQIDLNGADWSMTLQFDIVNFVD